METITTDELIQAVEGRPMGELSPAVSVISTDTRALPQGCVFLALRGERFDGNDFVKDAIAAGAAYAVTDREIPGCPCVVVADTGRALLAIAAAYRKKFSPILVGVTGSVGKTTTKNILAQVISKRFATLKTQGNLNNEIGLPKTLLQLTKEHEAAVIEMGMSHFGEISRLSRTAAPTMAVITNIGFSHIGNLGSQEGILQAKLEILEGMAADAPLFVNGDDALLNPLQQSLRRPVITYGVENEQVDVRGSEIVTDGESTHFLVTHQGETQAVSLPCIGLHNVMNALAAYGVGRRLGMTGGEIAAALACYEAEAMRQTVLFKNGQTVLLDCYNASPDSMRAALNVLRQYPAEGRRIAVLGDMLELGEQTAALHAMVGRLAAEARPAMLFCYGPASAAIGVEAVNHGIPVQHFLDKKGLADALKAILRPGDTVLFKASRGMRLEEVATAVYGDLN